MPNLNTCLLNNFAAVILIGATLKEGDEAATGSVYTVVILTSTSLHQQVRRVSALPTFATGSKPQTNKRTQAPPPGVAAPRRNV